MTVDRGDALREIAAQSRCASERYCPPCFADIDLDRPFVPEHFTQLYHTPCYRALDDAQRLRYNQLYGLRSNELFMLFEEGFTRRVIQRLQETSAGEDPLLGECLEMMLLEESRHHRMFLDFNREVLPEAYGDDRGFFARPGPIEGLVLRLMTQNPQGRPFMLWLILLLEEFSTAFSRLLIASEQTEGLAADYVRLHRLHMLDEVRHVGLDETVLNRLLQRLSRRRQAMNGRAFRVLLHEMLSPKRSGIRVLRVLAREFPGLAPSLPTMVKAVKALPQDPGMSALITDAACLPVTHALMQRYPAYMP